MSPSAADKLSLTFAALADPTRRAILSQLMAGPASVKELSAPFDISGPAVSKHLRVLERARLVTSGREGQWRPRKLNAMPLQDVAEFAEGFREHWDTNFAQLLDDYSKTSRQAKNKPPQ
jgi:DNA-binding transcriptional ArsR family regulator